jgi:16S rRNA C1402 (ribose-2'-O) methylase RsmI
MSYEKIFFMSMQRNVQHQSHTNKIFEQRKVILAREILKVFSNTKLLSNTKLFSLKKS